MKKKGVEIFYKNFSLNFSWCPNPTEHPAEPLMSSQPLHDQWVLTADGFTGGP